MATYKLVLIRHGESNWNQENRFCGWFDADLSEAGESEAKRGGLALKGEVDRRNMWNNTPTANSQPRLHNSRCTEPDGPPPLSNVQGQAFVWEKKDLSMWLLSLVQSSHWPTVKTRFLKEDFS